MKTLLLSIIKDRFYWEKTTNSHMQGRMNYRLYDNVYISEKYFDSLSKMQNFMIDEVSSRNPFIPPYRTLWNERKLKRTIKSKEKLKAKYASKFKRKSWWDLS